MKHIYPTLYLLLVGSSVAYADLRYTTHVEVRITKPSMGTDAGVAALIRMMMPPEDTVTFVGADAVRIEQLRDGKKAVILLRIDGQTILDPEARTYTRVPELGDVLKDAAAQPAPTFRRTGVFATINGLRAERVEVTMPIALPTVPPAGFPTVVTMTGEIWLSDTFKTPGPGVRKAVGLPARLPSALDGMILRQILRSVEFGYEVESTVTELNAGPIAPAMFEIPRGYREVSPFTLR